MSSDDPAPITVPNHEVDGGPRSLGVSIGALVMAWGAALATFPIQDNSFLTHLATGRLILDTGSVPTADPYTFTALGTDWTVQSWLASVLYAGVEQLGGAAGLRLLAVAVYCGAALVLWRLSRPATSIVVRILLMVPVLMVATDVWSLRPYMIGAVGLGVVWLALDGAVRPWLLVPLLWVWANMHGSYPMAIVLGVVVLVGARLDGASIVRELAVVKAVVVGCVVAAISPLGIEVWLFPLKSVTQSDVLSAIVEWRSPLFQSTTDRAFLALVVAAILGLTRAGRWRLALPTVVFVAAAIVAQRNVVMALTVLVPVLAACAPSIGTLRSDTRLRLGPALAVTGVALALVLAISALGTELTTYEPYPARALVWADAADLGPSDVPTATQDFTGNLLEALDGPAGAVFVDDRADMFPSDVFTDAVDLANAEARWEAVLDRYDVQTVVWERSTPLGSLLAGDDDWFVAYSDTEWLVACRRDGVGCPAPSGSPSGS